MIRRFLSILAAFSAAVVLSNCASPGGASVSSAPASYGYNADNASRSMEARPLQACAPAERPGLATGWGSKVDDKANSTIFDRDSGKPVGVAKVFYNNNSGAAAMAGSDYSYSISFRDYAGGIFRLGLRNHRGAALSAYQTNGNLVCIGEEGQRYSVEVENLSNHRLEFVVTVDGLDVLTGQPGSYARRGYVLDPGERREIKGWRTSMNEVASFKFGGVDDAYVGKKTGDTRNVGVIGCAVFAERGTNPKPYAGTDSYRRLRADPFVASPAGSGFATPPSR